MPKKRDVVTYALYEGSKKIYIGTTDKPERRLREHELEGRRFTRMEITSRRMTEDGAMKKEAEQIQNYRRAHGGKNPGYNIDRKG